MQHQNSNIKLQITIAAIGLLLLAGCSRTVTQMPTFGSEVNIEIDLAGTANVTGNRYFIVFSTIEAYQIPLSPPDSLDEFLEPGDEPQPGTKSKADYFGQYYSTWAGYVVIDSQGYSVVKGPFNITTPISREAIGGLGNLTDKFNFNLRLDRIFGATLPEKIYFDIITASYPANSSKLLSDRISPPVIYFEPIKGTIVSKSDVDTASVSEPSLDIDNWKINLP